MLIKTLFRLFDSLCLIRPISIHSKRGLIGAPTLLLHDLYAFLRPFFHVSHFVVYFVNEIVDIILSLFYEVAHYDLASSKPQNLPQLCFSIFFFFLTHSQIVWSQLLQPFSITTLSFCCYDSSPFLGVIICS